VQYTLESLLWGVSQLYQNNLFVNNLFEFLDVPAYKIVNGKRPVPERLELSIGQWQKMALARAFMRRAPIVVLDEPTSSIDAEAESEIFGQLQHIAAGATTMLIAHRFSTVRMADRIIVMKQGKIIEDGTHEALMAVDGTYAHLFRLQAAGYVLNKPPRSPLAFQPRGGMGVPCVGQGWSGNVHIPDHLIFSVKCCTLVL
jgi:ABC-type multidrug transport system fused ATPase/permease subunit